MLLISLLELCTVKTGQVERGKNWKDWYGNPFWYKIKFLEKTTHDVIAVESFWMFLMHNVEAQGGVMGNVEGILFTAKYFECWRSHSSES